MPAGYLKIKAALIAGGMNVEDAKSKAAAIWNKHHKDDPVTNKPHEMSRFKLSHKSVGVDREFGLFEFGGLSLGTTKNALRDLLKTSGAKFTRSPSGNAFYVPKTTSAKDLGALAETTGDDFYKTLSPHTIVVPRKHSIPGFESTKRDLALHEAGHAASPMTGPYADNAKAAVKAMDRYITPKDPLPDVVGEQLSETSLRSVLQNEMAANKTAREAIAKHGTIEEVAAWTKIAKKQMRVGYQSPIFGVAGMGKSLTQKKEVLRDYPWLRSKFLDFSRLSDASSSHEFGVKTRIEDYIANRLSAAADQPQVLDAIEEKIKERLKKVNLTKPLIIGGSIVAGSAATGAAAGAAIVNGRKKKTHEMEAKLDLLHEMGLATQVTPGGMLGNTLVKGYQGDDFGGPGGKTAYKQKKKFVKGRAIKRAIEHATSLWPTNRPQFHLESQKFGVVLLGIPSDLFDPKKAFRSTVLPNEKRLADLLGKMGKNSSILPAKSSQTRAPLPGPIPKYPSSPNPNPNASNQVGPSLQEILAELMKRNKASTPLS